MPTLTALFLLALATAATAPQPPVIAVPSPPPQGLYPIPPAQVAPPPVVATPPVIIRAPQPRLSAQDYVTPADYPASALANRQEGRVAFMLAVGPNGRVHGCAITRSSGWSALDSVTCAIMIRRARFTPAIDSNGSPASAMIMQEVEWKLPAGEERG